MANPSKSPDPTAAAMSAIEEALNLVDLDKDGGKDSGKQPGPPSPLKKPEPQATKPRLQAQARRGFPTSAPRKCQQPFP